MSGSDNKDIRILHSSHDQVKIWKLKQFIDVLKFCGCCAHSQSEILNNNIMALMDINLWLILTGSTHDPQTLKKKITTTTTLAPNIQLEDLTKSNLMSNNF